MSDARQLGPYRLIARLGAGAMGEVWRAVDTRLDRHVALKILPPGTDDLDARGRLLREAKAAAAVPHPSVVALYDVGTDDEIDYLVMELVEGRTLAELLREGPLPAAHALAVSIELCEALAAAHRRGILHRDVKPANIMITPDGRVKVLDFGIARLRAHATRLESPVVAWREARRRFSGAMDATLPAWGGSRGLAERGAEGPLIGEMGTTREGTLMGTPAYFAPEQVAGKLPDERSEVWSAGLVAYEAFAGVNPFHAPSFDALFAKILELEPPPLASAPAAVRDAIQAALARDPSDRHPTMEAFAAALRGARDVAEVRRRRRWPWIAAASLVAALAAGGAVFVATRRPAATAIDRKVDQALAEYDVFFNEKAAASLRAAMRLAPDDPRPHAYLILMGYAEDDELHAAAAALRRSTTGSPRARALATAAVALLDAGPAAARLQLGGPDAIGRDRELAFWAAELAFRANDCGAALAGYATLLAQAGGRFRGRAYDHQVACLLDREDFAAAARAGEAYARDYPGEPDAVGVQASAYAAAGRLDEALVLGKEALELARTEDTVAGLAKVHALRGEVGAAVVLYEDAVRRAPEYRRPLRRAALGALLLMNDRVDEARAAVAPCLPGGPDADRRTSTVCWFVAGLADEARVPALIPLLEARAHPSPPAVPYGRPDALARVLRARVALGDDGTVTPDEAAAALGLLGAAGDLYLGYHLPFLSTYVARLRAQVHVLAGLPGAAIPELERALATRPSDAPCLLQLAGAQAASGRRDLALRTLDRLDQLWPTADPDGHVPARAALLRRSLSTL